MTQPPDFEPDFDEQFPHLPGAPIVEAVIHWACKAGKEWVQDELKQNLIRRLPAFSSIHASHEYLLEVAAEVGPNASAPTHRRQAAWRGFRLESEDGRYIMQFNRDGLAFSRLAPYDDWQTFTSAALGAWKVFRELAEPIEVQRLGVRFINLLAGAEVGSLAKFLKTPPKCLEPIGLPLSSFLYQSTHNVPGYPYQVRVVETIKPPSPAQAEEGGLLLDIDVFTTQPMQPDDDATMDHLAKMHWLKNKAFFSLLSRSAQSKYSKGAE